MRVLMAGGGTAGHINPALAIAGIIRERYPHSEVLFAGTPFGMEARLVPHAGYDFAPIKVLGFQRSFAPDDIIKNLKAAGYLMTSGFRAAQIIKVFRPDLVVGTGGYVSGPIVRKAAKMGIKTVIHESNAYPGVTTKLLSKYVDCVMLPVEEAKKYLAPGCKAVVTGNPIRGEILLKSKQQAREELHLDSRPCILSFGGSLGAGTLNRIMADVIAWHCKDARYHHIHGYGRMGKDTFLPALEQKGIDVSQYPQLDVREYIDNMDTCMAAADLVICRAGASTLSELQAVGKASILLPSPNVAENHQYHNAMVLQNHGAAVVIEDKDVTAQWMIRQIEEICDHPDRLRELSENAKKLAITDTDARIYAVIDAVMHGKS